MVMVLGLAACGTEKPVETQAPTQAQTGNDPVATEAPADEPIKFIKNGDIVYEIYTPLGGEPNPGKIDHICFVSEDIEADYRYCVEQGYPMCTNGIQDLPTVWEKGVRYFKLISPSGEPIEFCQVL